MRVLTKERAVPRALILIFGCYACSVSPAWSHAADGPQRDNIEQVIEPDDIYELCLVLTPQQQLRYVFTATHKLGFNIHYHENGAVRYPVADHQISTAEATLAPESEQEYCLMWTNEGEGQVTLSLEYGKEHHWPGGYRAGGMVTD